MASKARPAASAGVAAGRKKQAALDGIPPKIENAIKSAVVKLGFRADTREEVRRPAFNTDLVNKIVSIYDDLCTQQGFHQNQVERALRAVPLHAIAVNTALDWLLIHLDRDDLPRQFAAQVQAAGQAEVIHRATTAPSSSIGNEAVSPPALGEICGAGNTGVSPQSTETQNRIKTEQDASAEEDKEKAARKAWILRYAQEESESDEDSDEGDSTKNTDTDNQDGVVIEDWEVWGDPRDIEQRKALRARGALARKDRLGLIAEELSRAKLGAVRAKELGDKAGQRACGQIIGQLKKEMAELGVEESDLPPLVHQDACTNQSNLPDYQEIVSEARSEEPFRSIDDGNSVKNDGSEPGLDVDLFDDSAVQGLEIAPGAAKAAKRRAKLLAAASMSFQPWGIENGRRQKDKKKTKDVAECPELQLPKSTLQQLCQRFEWPPPKYERLPLGGLREDSSDLPPGFAGDYRYCVMVEAKRLKKGGSTPPSISGRREFRLPAQLDGWSRIEDAQNAAATLALLTLFGSEDPELWRRLSVPFNELWLQLQEEEMQKQESNQRDRTSLEEARRAFATELVNEKREEESIIEASSRSSEALQASFENTLDAGEVWADLTRRALRARRKEGENQVEASARMQRNLLSWRASSEGIAWVKSRNALPVSSIRGELLAALVSHDMVVVSGATGSGKTTQVPQFILEQEIEAGRGNLCNIICTQPRRIAAISVAERVAAERGDPPPGIRGGAVGYAVRADSAVTPDTRLLFCTTGVLLRRLASDPALASVTHVVVDEVHERTMQGDFLVALLRDLVHLRENAGFPLKVILMSATLDSHLFVDYFGGCPALHAEGRTFPVKPLFLEDVYEVTGYLLASDAPAARRNGYGRQEARRLLQNATRDRHKATVQAGWGDEGTENILNPLYDESLYAEYSAHTRRNLMRLDEDKIDLDLIEELVGTIHEAQDDGAILVFLPGMSEIAALQRRLAASRRFAACWLVMLHSSVSPSEQRRAFRSPPAGTRKVVIATNIAETSLTIEDVVFVIDSGKLKERRHDPHRSMSLLVEDWVSVASAKQRRGRAGRVREGVCYALYTRHRYEHRMKAFQTPEVARVPLEELVMQVHLLRVSNSAADFAAKLLQPPPARAIDGALRVLRDIGALADPLEHLTPLGHLLAQMPVDVRIGKLLLLGAMLRCLAPTLTIAACLSHKTPFSLGPAGDDTDRARAAFASPDSGTIAAGQQSDHLIMAAAVDGWRASRRKGGPRSATQFARRYGLNEQTLEMLEDMRAQYFSMLADIGFLGAAPTRSGNNGVLTPDDLALPFNSYARSPGVIKAALLAALFPHVAVMDDISTGPGQPPAWHDGTGAVVPHPSSVIAKLEASRLHRPFLTYLEKLRTSKVFLRDCTVVSPAALLLFGGKMDVNHVGGRVTLDGWLSVRTSGRAAALIRQLRAAFETMLKVRVSLGTRELSADEAQTADLVVATMAKLLNYEETVRALDL